MAKQKQSQVNVCNDWMGQRVDDENFLDKMETGDKSWFFEYDLSDKKASRAYVKKGELN